MKILIIGGTGTISTEITKRLVESGEEVTLLNRGISKQPAGVKTITADMNNEAQVAKLLQNEYFDSILQFILFTPEQAKRDIRLFKNKCKQYIFISSASAYQKPPQVDVITEDVPLINPFWQYSQDKADCEELFLEAFEQDNFPITIVRPSHTYNEKGLPVGIHGKNGSFAIIERILKGKPVVIQDNGETHWTLTHSYDFAKAFCALVGNEKAIGEAFHITTDEHLSWLEIYKIIAKAVGKELIPCFVSTKEVVKSNPDLLGSLVGDKANNAIFDNSKIKSFAPNFKCEISTEEGLTKATEHIMQNKELQVSDPEFDSWCDEIVNKFQK